MIAAWRIHGTTATASVGLGLVTAALGCGSRTALDSPIGTASQLSRGTGPDSGTVREAGASDGSVTGPGSDASGECHPVSLLPGASVATWSVSVEPSTDTILGDVYGAAVAADGSVFAVGCGDTSGLASSPAANGTGACFLVKVDRNGRMIFMNRIIDDVNDPLTVALVPDAVGGVALALRDDSQTVFGGMLEPAGCGVLRFDGCGDFLWARPFPGLDCVTSFAFAGDTSGGTAFAASCGQYCTESSLVIRLDEHGATTSERHVTGASFYAAALQADETLFLGGYGGGGVDFGGGAMDLGHSSVFFVTYDPSLAPLDFFATADGGSEMQAAATADGTGFVVAGIIDRAGVDLGDGPLPYSGPAPTGGTNDDIFLARLTTQLGPVFSDAYGDASEQATTSLCLDPDGTISWVGLAGGATSFNGTVISGDGSLGADSFLTRFSPDGTPEVVKGVPDGITQIGCAAGAYILSGYTSYAVDLGSGTIPSGGYLLKGVRP